MKTLSIISIIVGFSQLIAAIIFSLHGFGMATSEISERKNVGGYMFIIGIVFLIPSIWFCIYSIIMTSKAFKKV